MITKTSLSSKEIKSKPIYEKAKSFSDVKTTLNEESLEEWKDILEELSSPEIVKGVIEARKEYKEKRTISYNKILELK